MRKQQMRGLWSRLEACIALCVLGLVYAVVLAIRFHPHTVLAIWDERGVPGVFHYLAGYRKVLLLSVAIAGCIFMVTYLAQIKVKVGWSIDFERVKKSVYIPFLSLWYPLVGIVTALLIFGSATKMKQYMDDHKEVVELRDQIAQEKRIIHACGEVPDANGVMHDYTNSVEALERTVSRGARFIELDVKLTADKQLVCAHGGKLIDAQGNAVESVNEVSLEQFQTFTVDGCLTPLLFDQVLACMREHPEIYLILDIKTDVRVAMPLIAEKMSDMMDRAIVQIYHMNAYAQNRNLGFRNIILTLYRARKEELEPARLMSFAEENELVGFTFREKYTEDEAMMKAFKATGVALYVHTIDDPAEQQKYYDLGIDAVYTNVVPEKEEL